MALVGWLFRCYRKYIYIMGAQIIASASKFSMVASNIFSLIIAVFFRHIQKSVTVRMLQAESAS